MWLPPPKKKSLVPEGGAAHIASDLEPGEREGLLSPGQSGERGIGHRGVRSHLGAGGRAA